MVVGKYKVIGNISTDTVYDGLIKFYDTQTNRIITEGYYKKGVADGENTLFYGDGVSIAVKDFYSNGALNGYSYTYDKEGELLTQDFYFHGIRTGNCIEYLDGSPKYYWYCSLDHHNIFHINYDSVKNQKWSDFVNGTINFRSYDISVLGNGDSIVDIKSYFLCLINPPKFDFQYSIVQIDTSFRVLSVLKNFSKNMPWAEFDLEDKPEKINLKYAIRLSITDSINNKKTTVFGLLTK